MEEIRGISTLLKKGEAVASPFLFSIIGNLLKMFHVILTKP
jgi:hypothetical protein